MPGLVDFQNESGALTLMQSGGWLKKKKQRARQANGA
jgi:hypothetical protein